MVNCNTSLSYDYSNSELAMFKLNNYQSYVMYVVQGIIKQVVAERTLSQLQNNTKELNKACMDEVEKKLNPYGIDVTVLEIRDLVIPYNMQRAMAVIAESKQESKRKVIAAEGYLKSSKSYAKAAKNFVGHDIALQLNYYGMLKTITSGKKSTVLIRDTVIDL